jgi:hypothetical protein
MRMTFASQSKSGRRELEIKKIANVSSEENQTMRKK